MPLAQSGGIYPRYQPLPTLSAPSSSTTRRTWQSGARCSALLRIPFAILFSVVHGISRMGRPRRDDWAIIGIFLASLFAVYLALGAVTSVIASDPAERHWVSSLAFNLLGYSTVFLPGYLIIQYVRKSGYLDQGPPKCMDSLVRMFVRGSEETIDEEILREEKEKSASAGKKAASTDVTRGLTLLACFVGLQGSYLTWGVLQEKIMTRTYRDASGTEEGQFKDSQFLVFVNRILAFAIALFYIAVTRQPRHRAPLYKYSYCSFSNIISSWCQYEALKFISFPTQVLAKASKIIPVMIMGKIVQNKKYDFYEYIVALLISLGMVLFLFGSQEDRGQSNSTTFSGAIILLGYMTFDSFTSNWQNKLFDTYKMSSVQMMCGVNLFSCLLTSASLLQQGIFYSSLAFMSKFPAFGIDCVVLSICSAVGQLFIYYTISQFGAVVFIIIMTLRQAMAIILSCLIYSHPVDASGVFGVMLVFFAMFLKIYCGQRMKRARQAREALVKAAAANPAVDIRENGDEGGGGMKS